MEMAKSYVLLPERDKLARVFRTFDGGKWRSDLTGWVNVGNEGDG